MEELMQKMIDKVGIDRATAEKIIAFLEDHADDAVEALSRSGLEDRLPAALGGKLAGIM